MSRRRDLDLGLTLYAWLPLAAVPSACAIVSRVIAFFVWLRGLPMLARWAIVAALSAGLAGGAVGLVIGLFVYAPTAPFAAVELGLPAAIAGGFVGLVAGLIMTTARRLRRHGANSL
jgi:hypothetical protein